MADDDEVDILGDFDLDIGGSCYDGGVLGSQTADLLHDYIAPQWLLETTQGWYTDQADDKPQTSTDKLIQDDRQQFGFTSLSSIAGLNQGSVGSASCQWEKNETAWSDREKLLFEKGLEMFGRSWVRIAQFIGTKTSHQVKVYAKANNHVKTVSFMDDSSISYNGTAPVFSVSEIIDDMEIPASMEEVIAVVTTAQPTISVTSTAVSRKLNDKKGKRSSVVQSPKLLQSKGRKFRKVKVQRSILKKYRQDIERKGFETQVSIKKEPPDDLSSSLNSEVHPVANVNNSLIRGDLLSSSQEIVRIKKESNDSEDEGEIEVDDPDDFQSRILVPIIKEEVVEPTSTSSEICVPVSLNKASSEESLDLMETSEKMNTSDDLEALNESENEVYRDGKTKPSHNEILQLILDLPTPEKECHLDPNTITEDERLIHGEFFEGRATKTPKRYLKIRNHILECWQRSKPGYVTKTSVRTGLKNCGDVNCIGRIHAYLERAGAINFGCDQAQYNKQIVIVPSIGPVPNRDRPTKEQLAAQHQARIEAMRPRKKKGFQDVQFSLDGEGGCTIAHNEDGKVIETTMFQEQSKPRKAREKNKFEKYKLIYCKKFSDTIPPPFQVEIDLEALLVMDVHSHLCSTEVIGLLGGNYNEHYGVLHITRATPCRSKSTGMNCDMCPVSQLEAFTELKGEGLGVVGWYHSHPTFLPNPSVQDLETQQKMQDYFAKSESPFVGIIVSPYSPANKALVSKYRCIILSSDENSGSRMPYRFDVQVTNGGIALDSLLKNVKVVFRLLHGNECLIPLHNVFQADPRITYQDKMIESTKHHMETSSPSVPAGTASQILKMLWDIVGDFTESSNVQIDID